MNKYILLFAVLILAQNADAQNDKWWQKLFKKKGQTTQQDTTPDNKDVVPVVVSEPIDSSLIYTDVPKDLNDTLIELPTGPGTITYDLAEGIRQLDDEFRQNPPDVRGYRVQIFFGDLTPAREKRARFISSYPGVNCYLHQAAPNFGVRVGNFRDMEAAYRMLLELKGTYPSALIVPDKIEV